jgi:hypothetical protein
VISCTLGNYAAFCDPENKEYILKNSEKGWKMLKFILEYGIENLTKICFT